jgi:hypothetical protein
VENTKSYVVGILIESILDHLYFRWRKDNDDGENPRAPDTGNRSETTSSIESERNWIPIPS